MVLRHSDLCNYFKSLPIESFYKLKSNQFEAQKVNYDDASRNIKSLLADQNQLVEKVYRQGARSMS